MREPTTETALTKLIRRVERHVDFECGQNGRYAFMEEVRVIAGDLLPADPPATALREALVGNVMDLASSKSVWTGHEKSPLVHRNEVIQAIDAALYWLAAHPTPAEGLDVERLRQAMKWTRIRHGDSDYTSVAPSVEEVAERYTALASAPDVTDQEGRP